PEGSNGSNWFMCRGVADRGYHSPSRIAKAKACPSSCQLYETRRVKSAGPTIHELSSSRP
ncbi:MAG: hypothetical protein OXD01_04070, partial [Gammaproteobacteria bacterium]|nr:hypothetical protein [Gammaproteobacteria bacterium]